jgi:excisionase family DNA binding protein
VSVYVSAIEAAHHFGLSEKTVRRWIASGKLRADKRGRAYRVDLSELATVIGRDNGHASGPSADSGPTADTIADSSTADSRSGRSALSAVAELVGLVDRLTVENRQLAEAATLWQERAGTLADRLAVAESQLAALTAPESPTDASTATHAPEPTPELSAEPASSPWLRLWPPTVTAWPRLVVVGVPIAVVVAVLLLVTGAWPR